MRKLIRLFTATFLLATLPFLVIKLEKQLGQFRDVASQSEGNDSIHAENDLSQINQEDFQKAFKYQMLKKVDLDNTSEGPAINLGTFFIANDAGKRVHVCEKYKTLEFIFAADGVASAGEVPKIILRGPCLINSDQTQIEGLPLPLKALAQETSLQTEYTSSIPGTDYVAKAYLQSVSLPLPQEWSWIGVRLYGSAQEKPLEITGYEIISVLGEPLIITVPAQN